MGFFNEIAVKAGLIKCCVVSLGWGDQEVCKANTGGGQPRTDHDENGV